jgi:hypothetical protein
METISWTARVEARLAGRVPATTVAAALRAGGVVYDELSEAEALRRDLVTAGTDLWSLPAGQSSQLVATWCAYALHTLGEQLVESEYAASPRLKGYLPAMTADQAMVFLTAADTWSARARRAAADPGYDIAEETRLPASLPSWNRSEPCPPTHVEAMLSAARALRERAQAALADFLATRVPDERRGTTERLQGLLAEADAAIGRGERMWTPSRFQPLHRAVESALLDGLQQLFRLGQLLARPALAESAGGAARPARPLPGEAGFDPWCLSEPSAARSLRRDPEARAALDHLWRSDPDPAATLALFDEVEGAAADGDIAPDDGRNYDCTPWPAIYTARRPVTLAGHALRPGQQFTLDICVSDHGGREAEFRRDLYIGTFRPSDRLRYCDQEAERTDGAC